MNQQNENHIVINRTKKIGNIFYRIKGTYLGQMDLSTAIEEQTARLVLEAIDRGKVPQPHNFDSTVVKNPLCLRRKNHIATTV